MGLLLAELGLGHLGVDEDTDDGAVLLDALEVAVDLLLVISVLLGVLGEGLFFFFWESESRGSETTLQLFVYLLLAVVPVLVEAALELVAEVLGPDGGERAEATGGLDVANDTDDDDRGSLNDGDGVDNLLLVHLGTRAVDLADNVGHASLEAEEGSEVAGLGLVVLLFVQEEGI